MYTGHVGVALGVHGIKKSIPLWLLIFASQMPDWADAGLCLADIRTPIPGMYSHSIPAIAILALMGALIYCVMQRDPAGMALVALVVISHAGGDYLTGLKPTWDGGPMIGLELYKHPLMDFIIEAFVVLGGWLLYRRTLPTEKRSAEPAYTLLFVLVAIQVAADIFFTMAKGLKKC